MQSGGDSVRDGKNPNASFVLQALLFALEKEDENRVPLILMVLVRTMN